MQKSLFDKRNLHIAYNKSRALPEHTVELWMQAIDSNVRKESIRIILDLGCGTGHFCKPLADKFSAKVIGVDPSYRMLSIARENILGRQASFCCGTAEALPIRERSVNLAFLSMVYQHLTNREQAFCKIRKALSSDPPGYLCIRTSTRETIEAIEWTKFFESARHVMRERAETRAGIGRLLQESGFRLLGHSIISQEVAGTYREYCNKLGMRGSSSLQSISDDEFERGMQNLKAYFHGQIDAGPVFEDLEFFIFSKKDN